MANTLTAEHREYIEKIRFNARRLSSLTGSVLLLSKLENQQIPTDRGRFWVDEQIRQSIVALESQWEQKNIDLDVELFPAEYFGNELLMRYVWDNLISNAIKFTPEDSTVRIGLLERYDCAAWASWAAARCELPVYLNGISMGASTVLMVSALELPDQVHGIMADCGFTSPRSSKRCTWESPSGFVRQIPWRRNEDRSATT